MGFDNGRVVRVTLKATQGSKLQVNTFHYDLEDNTLEPANDPQSLADAFRDDVVSHFKALYKNTWTIAPVVVMEEKDPQNPTAARNEWTSGSSGPGTLSTTGDALPHAMCAVASLTTDHIGRRFRGRLFLGGDATENWIDAGVWNTGTLALWQAFLDAIPRQPDIVSGESSSTAKWSVYSRTQRAQDLDPYLNAISGVGLSSRVHWLRSRDE